MEQDHPAATGYAVRRHAERRREQRALGPALLLSAAVHAVALLAIGFHVDATPERRPPQQVITPAEPVMRAYDIAAVAATADVPPVEAQVREQERLPEVPAPREWVAPPPAPEARPAEPAPARSPHERLQYRLGAAEIWKPGDPLPARDLSADERVQGRVAAELRQYNDSVAAENAARARAMDWTVRDGNGNRWGIADGTLHLGSIRIQVDMPLGDELKARERTWTELQLQADRIETREQFNDRVRAIRERTEQERARRNAGAVDAGSGTGGSTAGPSGGGTSGGGGSGG